MDIQDIAINGATDRAKEFPASFNTWKTMWISNFNDSTISNAVQGMIWYNNDTNKLRYYDKYSSWNDILNGDDRTTINASISSLSTSTDTALALKADLESPILTGIPKTPTATAGDSSTQIASTAFVTSAIDAIPEITKTDSVDVESSTIVASATAVKTAYDMSLHRVDDTEDYSETANIMIAQQMDGTLPTELATVGAYRWGELLTINDSYFRGQLYLAHKDNNDSTNVGVYVRTGFKGTASTDWHKLISDGDIPKTQGGYFGKITFTRENYGSPKVQTFKIVFPEAFTTISDIHFSFIETSSTNHAFLIVGTAYNLTTTGCTVFVQTSMDTSQTAVCKMYYRAFGS